MVRKPFDPNLIQPPAELIATPVRPVTGAKSAVITVAQVTTMVKRAIELVLPTTLHVVGQISNFKRHSSGHLYFTLKDQASELSCVMWRSAAEKLKFKPADGLEVVTTGRVEVFERSGRYQLYVRKIEPRGVGALELAFRQLCDKLAEEGLFEPQRKKKLPRFPKCITIVTSPTGAAIADMIRTIERRYPCVQVLIYPVRVQGDGAAREIAVAIRKINTSASVLGGVDLMIVGRGGGSLEDLWAFNEEIVARAIDSSAIPIISAVGHEVDVTVADLVADVRAATPTAAAQLAVPMLIDVLGDVAGLEAVLHRTVRHRTDISQSRFQALVNRPSMHDPSVIYRNRAQTIDETSVKMERHLIDRIRQARQRIDRLEPIVQKIAPHVFLYERAIRLMKTAERLRRAMEHRASNTRRELDQHVSRLDRSSPTVTLVRLKSQVNKLGQLISSLTSHRLALLSSSIERQAKVLTALGYKSILNRGFSITRTKRGRKLIRSIEDVRDKDRIVTEIADGQFESEILNRQQLELFE